MSPRRLASLRSRSPRALGLVLACGGCFRDDPPQFGCAGPFDACPATTTEAAGTSSTSEPTTTTATTLSATTGGPVDTSRYFRLDSLTIIDPHLFLGSPCADVTAILNETALAAQIESGDFNLLLGFDDYNLDALEPALSEADACDVAAMTCTVTPSITLSVPADRIDAGDCSTLDPAVVSLMNLAGLHSPQPTCFRTLPAELALPIQGAKIPLTLLDAQIVFNFDPLDDATAITNGLLYGFFPRESAEATTVSLLMFEVDTWSLITGAQDPNCAMVYPGLLPSTEMYEGREGVWMAVNFTAVRVEVIAAP